MEEPKAAQPKSTPTQVQVPNPALPPQPPSANSKKRPLHNDSPLHNSKRFKLPLLLKDLRPHFLEVLRTPDFRNCKAANEIQEQMKLVVDLYKEMISEMNSSAKKNVAESQPLSGESKDVSSEQLQTDNKSQSSTTSEKPQSEVGDVKGSYVVGGSAFGWNFITFSCKDPVYYGVTKESFRASKVIPK